MSYNALSPTCSFSIALSSISIPNSVTEALSQFGWKEAIEEEEMQALENNIFWDIVELPRDKEPV